MHKKFKKEHLEEAEAILMDKHAEIILAEHFQQMDDFFKKYPGTLEKWENLYDKKK